MHVQVFLHDFDIFHFLTEIGRVNKMIWVNILKMIYCPGLFRLGFCDDKVHCMQPACLVSEDLTHWLK